jgi:hypothetical protein
MAGLAVLLASLLVPSGATGQTLNTITPVIRGTLGANNWYTSNVTVNWVIDPLPDSSTGCDAFTLTADTRGVTRTCSATWGGFNLDGNVTIKIDKTLPSASGAPSRPPDANGWYNKPVGVSFSGTDAMSGIAGCSSATYSGPDSAAAAVSGTCTDKAGNVRSAVFSFPYDATPPTLGKVTLAHGNRSVLLRWTVSADTQLTQITRSGGAKKGQTATVYRGAGKAFRDKGLRVGAKYQYTVTAIDPASNTAAQTRAVTATGPLLNPEPGQRVSSPPRLAWMPVKRATYYNVQLIHNGTILSAWPTRANLQLKRSWIYKGRRHRLRPGVYRWYVWPGFGLLAQANYGRRIGGSSFVVAR